MADGPLPQENPLLLEAVAAALTKGIPGVSMKDGQLSKLRAFSLCCLLPGLAGLILATAISTHYMNSLPRFPDPQTQRMIPRNINGYLIYQTEQEEQLLDRIEYSSVVVFLIGLCTGLVYLQKWGLTRAAESEEDDFVPESREMHHSGS